MAEMRTLLDEHELGFSNASLVDFFGLKDTHVHELRGFICICEGFFCAST